MQPRVVLLSATSTATSMALASTSIDPDLAKPESNGTATLATPATIDEPVSPLLPCNSDRLIQTPERLRDTLKDCSSQTLVSRQAMKKLLDPMTFWTGNLLGVGDELHSCKPYLGLS